MSLRLLLEDFLGLMREEGELDVYLPLLLSAMGHEIVFRAQKGPRQYGVDIVSVGVDKDRRKKLFLWLVKCGDIGRSEWSVGKQSIRQSIEDVGDVYLSSHIAPQHRKLTKKLVVLTNGDFKSELTQTLAGYLNNWSKQNDVGTEMVNGSTLAAWTEDNLLDENALPPANKTLFRRMLANIPTPELCLQAGYTLIDNLVVDGTTKVASVNAQRKKHLSALRAIRTALSILFIRGQREGNLLGPYRLAEFALLRVWAGFQDPLSANNKEITTEFSQLLVHLLGVAEAYHAKLQVFYCVKDAFASVLPDNLLVAERVFDELGRLGLNGYIWAHLGASSGDQGAIERAHICSARIAALIDTHACVNSPCYDHQAIDLHMALLCLMATNRFDLAKTWLHDLIVRLQYVSQVQVKRYWPLNATFQQALELRTGSDEFLEEYANTSMLIPILALWAAALGMPEGYTFIRNSIAPQIPDTTLNVWNSDVGFENTIASYKLLCEHGVAEAIHSFPENPGQYISELATPIPGLQSIDESLWYRSNVPYLPLLAALHWRLQIPREMMARQATALADAKQI
ncbi:MAG: hypothetical protein EPO47_01540 [Rugosibacter sp.]|nr:MAG: hypothetical protein EPO47_01540 [Rugosibacter sp.]